MTFILGIETSCDETAAAIVRDGPEVLSNVIASQHDLHRRYHGVVPEIASRAHLERILPVVAEALELASIRCEQVGAVAVGNRPGLIGSLLVGVSAAKAIAWAAAKPLIGVNHIQAHLYAASLSDERIARSGEPPADEIVPIAQESTDGHRPSPQAPDAALFPALGLVVSGGHTSLYEIGSPTRMKPLGKTIDDAVGEAYDKAAVILGIEYPGGPNLDRMAQGGDPSTHELPRSLLTPDSLDFSFSGLKTALLYKVCGHPVGRGSGAVFPRSNADLTAKDRADLAAAFQQAAVDTLVIKLGRAIDIQTALGRPPRSIIIGGGVSANSLLRARVTALGAERRLPVQLPALAYCVDNAAMIAGLGHHHLAEGRSNDLDLPVIATADF